MARMLESLRRQGAPPVSGEATPRRDRRTGRGRMRLVTAALLVALPGVVTATMGEGTVGPQPSIVRHGQGKINPAGQLDWCLAGRAGADGTPPQENSEVEVRPCAPDNPFQYWNVAIEQTSGEPDKMIAQLHGFNLCIANPIASPREEAVPARLANCNDPMSTQQPKELKGYWEIAHVTAAKDEPQLLSVPARLKRPYPLAIWLNYDLARRAESENTLFVLPELHTGNTNVKLIARFKQS